MFCFFNIETLLLTDSTHRMNKVTLLLFYLKEMEKVIILTISAFK